MEKKTEEEKRLEEEKIVKRLMKIEEEERLEQEGIIKRLENRIEELEHKLYDMKFDMMLMQARLTNYKLDNINMGLSLSNQITATKIKN